MPCDRILLCSHGWVGTADGRLKTPVLVSTASAGRYHQQQMDDRPAQQLPDADADADADATQGLGPWAGPGPNEMLPCLFIDPKFPFHPWGAAHL